MEYRLSAVLKGDKKNKGFIKGIIAPASDYVVSSSTDGEVKRWQLRSSSPPGFEPILMEKLTKPELKEVNGELFEDPYWQNCLAYIPPSSQYPDGLIASGSDDNAIRISMPDRELGMEPVAILRKVETIDDEKGQPVFGKIIYIDVSEDGHYLVSANNDGTAKVWEVGSWKLLQSLKERIERLHWTSDDIVWSVLAFDEQTIVTASADGKLRIFHIDGTLIHSFVGSHGSLRALRKLPARHSSGAQFASGDTNGNISLWSLKGEQLAKLIGHTDVIYNFATSPSGLVVSCSEDRTVKIWDGTECLQSIEHPAVSVFAVALCGDTEDIITGDSTDCAVRIFSKAEERQNPEAIEEFTEAVRNFKRPNPDDKDDPAESGLPKHLVFPRKAGSATNFLGYVRQRNQDLTLFQWENNEWIYTGVIKNQEAIPSHLIEVAKYDREFDVAIGEGKATLKLRLNYSQTAEQAADDFIAEHPGFNNTDDRSAIINFIKENTKGITLGKAASPNTPLELHYLPVFELNPGLLPKLQKKILEFDVSLVQSGMEQDSLGIFLRNTKPGVQTGGTEDGINTILGASLKCLATPPSTDTALAHNDLGLLLHMCTVWPQNMRFPALNVLGNVAAYHPGPLIKSTTTESSTFIDYLVTADTFALHAQPVNVVMATRVLANLFHSTEGLDIVGPSFDRVHSLLGPFASLVDKNFNLGAAFATLYANYAVWLHTRPDFGQALQILEIAAYIITAVLPDMKDDQLKRGIVYRSTVAIREVLRLDKEELRSAARGVLEINSLMRNMDGKGDANLQDVKNEVAELLWKS